MERTACVGCIDSLSGLTVYLFLTYLDSLSIEPGYRTVIELHSGKASRPLSCAESAERALKSGQGHVTNSKSTLGSTL